MLDRKGKMNMFKRKRFIAKLSLFTVGFLFTTISMASTLENNKLKKPNVLIVILDDVGYSDLGVYGSEIETPHMDAIAKNGLSYSNFHSTPTCSPTRASLLTGRESHRVGVGLVTEYDFGSQVPPFRARITPKAATISEILRDKNVGTYAVGKWHLVPPSHQNAAGPFMHWPLGKGFDRFYGFHAGSTDQFKTSLVKDNTIIDAYYDKDEVLTTDLIDNAITYVTDHVSFAPDRPFFMYLALPGMHAPHQASDKYLTKYRGKYNMGWDKIRKGRFEKQKALGLIPKDASLSPHNKGIEKWDDLNATQRKVYARFQEVYAAMLDQTDYELGRFMAVLKQLNQLDNTLVILLSDNGGSKSGHFNGSSNSSAWNNGVKESVEDNLAVLDNLGRSGSGVNYPRGWAQTSNTPFPFYKTDTYGGGVNVPCIVSWPNGIKAQNEIRHQYHHVSDIMPTILDIMDIKIPTTFKGIEQLPVDGINMAYTFEDKGKVSKRTSQFYRMADDRGIYHDGWVASAKHKTGTPLEDDHWDLYNINKDFTQSNDISSLYPEKLKSLQKIWQTKAEELGADMMFESATPEEKKLLKPKLKTSYTLYPGVSHLLEKSTPKVMNRSFTIDVPVSEINKKTQGVLVAHGNSHSGYVMYVKDQKLIFEYNFLSTVKSVGKRYTFISKKNVPIGTATFSFQYTKTGSGKGKGRLLIDTKVVDELNMEKTITKRIAHEGLDVGQDRYNSVGKGYEGTFPFTARIEKVVYDIKKD